MKTFLTSQFRYLTLPAILLSIVLGGLLAPTSTLALASTTATSKTTAASTGSVAKLIQFANQEADLHRSTEAYNKAYPTRACASFVSIALKEAGYISDFCPLVEQLYKFLPERKLGTLVNPQPKLASELLSVIQPGDIFLLRKQFTNGVNGHTGIVVSLVTDKNGKVVDFITVDTSSSKQQLARRAYLGGKIPAAEYVSKYKVTVGGSSGVGDKMLTFIRMNNGAGTLTSPTGTSSNSTTTTSVSDVVPGQAQPATDPDLGFSAIYNELPLSRFSSIQSIIDALFANLNAIVYGAAFFALIITGLMFITASGDEDKAKKARRNIGYVIIGIVIYGLINVSIYVVRQTIGSFGLDNGYSSATNSTDTSTDTTAGTGTDNTASASGDALSGQ